MNEQLIKSSIENFLQEKSQKYSELYLLFLEFFQFYFKEEAKKYIKNLDEMPELRKTEENEFLEEIQALLTKAYLLWQTEEHMRIADNLSMYGYKMPETETSILDAQKYAELHAWELIKWINETTKNEINTIISLGLLGGQSKYEIAEQIKNTFDWFSLYRANLITHMEVTTAYNKASRSTNDKLTKELWVIGWKRALTQKDDKVRNKHKENEKAGWIPKNQKYPMETLNDFPPFDFNCRCSEVFSVVNPNTGKLFENEWFWALWYGYSDDELEEFYSTFWDTSGVFSKKQKINQEKFWLSNEEIIILEGFTAMNYRIFDKWAINPKNASKQYKIGIQFLINALWKLPKTEWILWRWHNAYDEVEVNFLKNLSIWDIYENKHFFSSSSNRKKSEEFISVNKYSVLFKIISQKGKNIHLVTNNNEQETLFFPRQLFVVDNIEEQDNIKIITLKDL